MRRDSQIQTVIELIPEIWNVRRPLDNFLKDYFVHRRFIGSKDRRAILNDFYHIVRHYPRFSWWITNSGDFSDHNPRFLILTLLVDYGMSSSEIESFFSDRPYGPSALVREEQDFLKGLLKLKDEKVPPDWVKFSLPEWIWNEGIKTYKAEAFTAEIKAFNEEASLDLRVNGALGTVESVLKNFANEGFEAEETPYSPWGIRLKKRQNLGRHPLTKQGVVEVQDEGAQILTALCYKEGIQKICDFCAGAGGKTLGLSALYGQKAEIYALDICAERLNKAKERAVRARVNNVFFHHLLSLDDPFLHKEAQTFDGVVVDVPCSGSGTWRRHPELKTRLTPDALTAYVDLQKSILKKASMLVKPGGELIYMTCSFLGVENEQQVERFLKENLDFSLSLIDLKLKNHSFKGSYLHLSPALTNTDGFFAAVMKKST